jgi:hypothetical protein
VEPLRGAWFRSRSALRPARSAAVAEQQLGTALVAGAVLLLAAADGGFFPSSWRWGALALAAGGVVAWSWPGAVAISRAGVATLVLLACFGLWTALSAAWSLDAHASLLEPQRILLYAVALGAFLVARRGLVDGIVAGATLVALWSLADRYVTGSARDPFEGTLLAGPIGYANALGALVAIGAVAALYAGGPARLALVVLVPSLLLTSSRGAIVAAAVAVAVAGAVALGRRSAAAVLLAASAAALAVLLAVPVGGIGDRAVYWRVARSVVPQHVAAGSGAGTFAEVYRARRPGGPAARNAHSLYLESLDEVGVVGLVLLLAALAVPAVAGLAAGRAAAVGAYTVFLLHAGVDWDWQMPVVTVAALAAAAACTVGPPSGRTGRADLVGH